MFMYVLIGLSILFIIFIWVGSIIRIRDFFFDRAELELTKIYKGQEIDPKDCCSYYYYLSSKNVIRNIFFIGLRDAIKPAFMVFTFIVNISFVLFIGCGIWFMMCVDSFAASLCYRILGVIYMFSTIIRFFLLDVKFDRDLLQK